MNHRFFQRCLGIIIGVCNKISGRFKLEKDEEDGSYFIDRSPEYFEIILDYLR